jgi:DNA-binding NarL/FixJ family response regulator
MKTTCAIPRAPRGASYPVRTLIVDDSPLLLSCLRQFLDGQALVHVVGTATNGIEALHKAESLTPDLVLMDLHMPRMDGLQATTRLRSRLPNTRIIIMTLDETVSARASARKHGAHGFVGKTHMPRTLTPEIRRVFLRNAADVERGAT